MSRSILEEIVISEASITSAKPDGEFSALVTLRMPLDTASKMGFAEGDAVLIGHRGAAWVAMTTLGKRSVLAALMLTALMELGDTMKESAHDLANAIRAGAASYEVSMNCPTEDAP